MDKKRELFPKVPLYYSIPMLSLCIVALVILVFIFRIEYSPILLLQPVPGSAINVSSCGVLDQNNSYYVLNQSLYVSIPSCITIIGNNLILDGQGIYSISNAPPLSLSTAVEIRGNNVTIKRINFIGLPPGQHIGTAISSFGNDTYVFNNTIINSTISAITMSKVINPKIEYNYIAPAKGNTLAQEGRALSLDHVINANFSYNNIVNSPKPLVLILVNSSFIGQNNMEFFGVPGSSNVGIGITSSHNNIISFNQIRNMNHSIFIASSNGNIISDNLLYESYLDSIFVLQSNQNNFSGGYILDSKRNGLVFETFPSVPIFSSIEGLVVVNSTDYDLNVNPFFFSGDGLINLYLKGSYFDTYRFNNTYLRYSENNQNTWINFAQPITTFGNNLTSHIRTAFNFAEVRSDLNSGLNKSATITFSGLPNNATNFTVLRNGVACPVGVCTTAVFNSSTGVASFAVNGWTNYSLNYIQGQGVPTLPNPLISEPDPYENYTLSQFPVTFEVSISLNGSIKFTLNNGITNTTMNTTDNRAFTYSQPSLALGNYTFRVYATSTSGINSTQSVNFSVVNENLQQTIDINEPDPNEEYSTADFPVDFRVNLNYNGTINFTLNNGITNITMNTSDNRSFTYEQSLLSAGNYTFRAYALFSNGTRINDSVKFSVINTSGSTGGNNNNNNNGGSGGGGGSSGGSSTTTGSSGTTGGGGLPQFNSSTTSGTGNTQNLGGTQQSSNSVLRNTIYWLLISVISIAIVILSILIFKAIRGRKGNEPTSPAIKSAFLGKPQPPTKPMPSGLVSNLR